jgi:hypothetical protein
MDDNAAIEERIYVGVINVVEESWLEDEASYRRFRPLKINTCSNLSLALARRG